MRKNTREGVREGGGGRGGEKREGTGSWGGGGDEGKMEKRKGREEGWERRDGRERKMEGRRNEMFYSYMMIVKLFSVTKSHHSGALVRR